MKQLNQAGKYNREFAYYPVVYTPDNVNGGDVPSYPSTSENYWGKIEEKGGAFTDNAGTMRSVSYATITLRQVPTLSSQDQLVDLQYGNKYLIDTIALDWTNNETVVIAHRVQNNTV